MHTLSQALLNVAAPLCGFVVLRYWPVDAPEDDVLVLVNDHFGLAVNFPDADSALDFLLLWTRL